MIGVQQGIFHHRIVQYTIFKCLCWYSLTIRPWGNANTSGISSTGTLARYFSRESLSCKAYTSISVRSIKSKLSIQRCKFLFLSSWKIINDPNVWLDSDMAFKLEPSKTQVSSTFTPMEVKLFEWRFISDRCVFLFSLSRYSAILTAPSESILLLWR